MGIEYNDILYDTDNDKLARLLEAIRQHQKDNRVRVKIKWFCNLRRKYSGYIAKGRKIATGETDKITYTPIIVWHAGSSSGFPLDPDLIKSIEFASKSLAKGDSTILYSQSGCYISHTALSWIENAAIVPTGANSKPLTKE